MEPEKTLSAWWGSATGRTVRTGSGVVYRIQYPGRLNGGSGPDYRGAVLHMGGRTLLGDVELHVRSSDWRRHGHDSDHEYDSVVLHVVFKDDSHGNTTLASGKSVHVAVPQRELCPSSSAQLPCVGRYAVEPARVSEVLAREGITRLLGKGKCAAELLRRVGSHRALLLLVARTLGYTSNSAQFEALAHHLCVPSVQAVLQSCSDLEREALLMGLAGLLPSQRKLSEFPGLNDCLFYEEAWRCLGLEHLSMPTGEWKLGCIYPNNHPVRRLVGLADLLPSLRSTSEELGSSLASRLPQYPSLRVFEERVRVQGHDYWRGHYDFHRPTPDSDVVGRGKAREIVVNALLPLAVAMTSRDILNLARLNTAIRAYPATGPNAITRHMRAQLGIGRVAVPAVESQGMLRLFGLYCTRGLCEECPLGGRPLAS